MKTCKFPSCTRRATERDHCHRHYEKLTRLGYLPIIARPIDSTVVRARIDEHLSRGRALCNLAEAAGVHSCSLREVYERGTRIRMTTAAKILAVPLPPSPTGVRRRLEALQRIGYSAIAFARVSGIPKSTLDAAARRNHYTMSLRERICDSYERLSATPLDAPQVIARAIKLQYYAPADWEYVDIDDPDVWPEYLDQQGNEEKAGTWTYTELPHDQCVELLVKGEFYDNIEGRPLRAAKLAAVVELTEQGWSGKRIAAWLRMTPRTVRNMRVESAGERPAPQLQHAELHCRSIDRHPFTPSNTRIDGRGRRHCRICETRSTRARRAKARKVAA